MKERQVLLAALVAASSMLCWWPVILRPSLDLAVWIPLIVIALSAGLATILAGGRWLLFGIVSAAATGLGMLAGFAAWPLQDGIAQSYAGIACLVATIAVAVVSILAGLAGQVASRLLAKRKLAVWIVFAGCVAFGPATLAVGPIIIGKRVAHNDKMAAERFASLKLAVEKTNRTPGGCRDVSDGQVLKRNYSGPPFSDGSWRYIAGNAVIEDGYYFSIQIDCSQTTQYVIDAQPVRPKTDGSRRFCTDQTGNVGCGVDVSNSPMQCIPCAD